VALVAEETRCHDRATADLVRPAADLAIVRIDGPPTA
jgi:hypothetical protein